MTRFEIITRDMYALTDFLLQFNDVGFAASEETCSSCNSGPCLMCSKSLRENLEEYLNSEILS